MMTKVLAIRLSKNLMDLYTFAAKKIIDDKAFAAGSRPHIKISNGVLAKAMGIAGDDAAVIRWIEINLNTVKVRRFMSVANAVLIRQVYFKPGHLWIGPTDTKTHSDRMIKEHQIPNHVFVLDEFPPELSAKLPTPPKPVTAMPKPVSSPSSSTLDPAPSTFDPTSPPEPEPEPEEIDPFMDVNIDHVEDIEENGEKFFMPEQADEIYDCIKNLENVYIAGPHGCGKSRLSELLVKKLGVEPVLVDFSAGIDEATFLGTMMASVDADGNNVTEFQYGVFPKAILEDRPIIINEIDFAKPQYLAALHGILEEKDPHLVLMDNGGEVLRPKSDGKFMVIATANTMGYGDDAAEYHGTGALNSAFLDRFDSFFNMGYSSHEAKIIDSEIGNIEVSMKIVSFVKDIRKLKESDAIDSTISTRRLKMFAKKLKRIGIKKAMENVILTRIDPEEREQVLEIAQRHFPKYF